MTPSPAQTGHWIRRFHPAPDAPVRLVCFPHAGGSAPFYFPLSRTLSPGVEVLAIQYPGRQDRRAEPCVDNVGRLADLVTAELLPHTDRPLALFGHSLGATLAFEVAIRLEAAGIIPLQLFASGRRAPSRNRQEKVHELPDELLIANLKRLSGTDPALRNDYRAAETYRYHNGPPLTSPILVLTGDKDPEVDPEEAKSWAEHTTGTFDIQVYPGGHFYLTDHSDEVTQQISQHLKPTPTPKQPQTRTTPQQTP